MLSYKEWKQLKLDEARTFQQKGPAGGAFGKTRKSQYAFTTPALHSRDDHQTANHASRVAFGTAQEPKIIQAAKDVGLDIVKATKEEDMFGGTDGWLRQNGKLIPIQIKYRDNQNDLGFEVLNPIVGFPLLSPKNRLGRDFKFAPKYVDFGPNSPIKPNVQGTGAEYTLHLDSSGTKLSLIPIKQCYNIIHKLMQQVDYEGRWANGTERRLNTTGGTLLIKRDNSNGVQKVLAYLPISSIGDTKQYNVHVSIG